MNRYEYERNEYAEDCNIHPVAVSFIELCSDFVNGQYSL